MAILGDEVLISNKWYKVGDKVKDAKITQQELSDKLGTPQSFVSKYESGERRLDVVELLQITEVLGIDIFPLIREIQAMVKQR